MNRVLISLAALLGAALPLLLDSALNGAAILTAVGMTMVALRRASAATRHWVWSLAMTALLVLPALSALLPGWRVLPH